MFECKIMKLMWVSWIVVCVVMLYPNFNRPAFGYEYPVDMIVFVINGLLMLFFWYLTSSLLLSNFGVLILQTLPRSYLINNFNHLIFIKYFVSKVVYMRIMKLLECDDNCGRE